MSGDALQPLLLGFQVYDLNPKFNMYPGIDVWCWAGLETAKPQSRLRRVLQFFREVGAWFES